MTGNGKCVQGKVPIPTEISFVQLEVAIALNLLHNRAINDISTSAVEARTNSS
ncbi:hypothetical protein LEP3755_62930 (plasmid) [Leptolyngbya sp. NIES-3755]|nr:hypothetical protein LEP3755_62930 [Leptolyngbya sp. NIES-3755]